MKQLKNKITRKYRHRPLKVNYLNYPANPRAPDNRSVLFVYTENMYCHHYFLFVMHIESQSRAQSSRMFTPESTCWLQGMTVWLHYSCLTIISLTFRLHELEDGIDQEDATRYSTFPHRSVLSESARSAPLSERGRDFLSPLHIAQSDSVPPSEIENYSSRPTLRSPTNLSPPFSPPSAELQPPPITLSPLQEMPPAKPHTHDLETKLKLESRVIELQGKHKEEAKARRQLEKDLAMMEESRMVDMETVCELEQRVHDLEEKNQLYKEKVSSLLATPPLVCAHIL